MAKLNLTGTGVLAVAGLAVGGLLAWKALSAGRAIASSVGNAVVTAAEAVNPLNHDNVFAAGVNAAGGAIVTDPYGPGKNADGSWSVGGWIYDVTHPDAAEELRRITGPVNTGGATGSW